MPRFMLLLHDNPDGFTALSPQQMQDVLEKYVTWGDRLRSSGVIVDGQKLMDEPGRVIRSKDRHVRVTDGPYSETKEVLGGYYAIDAEHYDDAVEIARTCPHLEYGGTIEVRQVDPMTGE